MAVVAVADDGALVPAGCHRCGCLVWRGQVDGLPWRMAGQPVPPADAAVLKHWGVTLLVLRARPSGAVWGAVWHPGDALAGGCLLAPHVCGAAINDESEDA